MNQKNKDEQHLFSNEINEMKSQNYEPKLLDSKRFDNWLPFTITFALIIALGLYGLLSYLAISNAGAKSSEKKRADTLQDSINALRKRSEEDRQFFETVRQLIVSHTDQERQLLVDELGKFKFSTTTSSNSISTTKPNNSSSTTATTIKSQTTLVSSITTTTQPPRNTTTTTTTTTTSNPPSSTTTTFCVITLIPNLCS